MGRGMKVVSLWHCRGGMEAQVCFDSGLKLICVVGSGVSQLPLDNTTQIIYRLQVRPVGWSVKHSNTMVSTPVTSSFGSVGRCQVTFIWKSWSQCVWRKTESHRVRVAWSPVWSFCSYGWFGVPWHLLPLCSTVLVLMHSVLSSPASTQLSTSTLCFHTLASFMEMPISISSSTWYQPTVQKLLVTGVLTMVLLCLADQPTSLTWSL